MSKKLDLAGKTFGRLTVIKETKQRQNRFVLWLCRCKCGNKILVRSNNLTSSWTRSCGCYQRERASETHRIHGESGINRSPLYIAWGNMIKRCSDKNNKRYGGRGITVCKAWQDYMVFRAWALTRGYRKDLQIDRIRNNGNYSPSNCRWATRKDNLRNTSRTRWEKINGEKRSLAAWCEIYKMPYSVVHGRLARGWGLMDAMTTPVKKNGR